MTAFTKSNKFYQIGQPRDNVLAIVKLCNDEWCQIFLAYFLKGVLFLLFIARVL